MSKRRKAFLGRHIMMKKDFAELVLAGIKTATIRLGVVKPKRKYVLLHSGGKVLAELEITGAEIKRVKDLTDEDAKQDGFEDKKSLVEVLKEIYGNIQGDDKVTIIRFKVVRRIGSSETSEFSQYLDLKPVDVASIALRYGIKLRPRDIIILKKVAESGSIRKAAVALFGDATKRKVVRRALNRAIKKLIESGVIAKKGPKEGEV